MGWLTGDVAAITGGGSGIGLAVARRFLAEGAAGVVILDRDVSAILPMEKEFPGQVVAVQGDVRDYASHTAMVAAATKTFGRLDILVGNAGVFDFHRPLESYSPETLAATFDEIFAINLRGYMMAAMAARPSLKDSHGCMIFTGSVASFHAGGGGVLYTAVKHAVAGMIRQLAKELAPDIRVNGVGPGGTLTNLSGTGALGHGSRSIADKAAEAKERIAAAVPLRFAQTAEDHTGLYVLLASRDNSRATTGEIFMSDGGIGIRPL
jgi:NAD(P)-dependent dehydrogenase (short-subunit alcohol dehydrogenase family)